MCKMKFVMAISVMFALGCITEQQSPAADDGYEGDRVDIGPPETDMESTGLTYEDYGHSTDAGMPDGGEDGGTFDMGQDFGADPDWGLEPDMGPIDLNTSLVRVDRWFWSDEDNDIDFAYRTGDGQPPELECEGNHCTSVWGAFYLFEDQQPGLVLVYQLYHPLLTLHILLTDDALIEESQGRGYVNQGALGYLSTEPREGLIPLYCLWNGIKTAELNTIDPNERGPGRFEFTEELETWYVAPMPVAEP